MKKNYTSEIVSPRSLRIRGLFAVLSSNKNLFLEKSRSEFWILDRFLLMTLLFCEKVKMIKNRFNTKKGITRAVRKRKE